MYRPTTQQERKELFYSLIASAQQGLIANGASNPELISKQAVAQATATIKALMDSTKTQ